MDNPLVVNKSIWLLDPYDKWGSAKHMEEGTEIMNCIVGVQGTPICVGNRTQSLHRTFHAWLSIADAM